MEGLRGRYRARPGSFGEEPWASRQQMSFDAEEGT